MKIINRIKTFLWVLLLLITCFVGIFIPSIHKAINEGTLVSARNLVKKYGGKNGKRTK